MPAVTCCGERLTGDFTESLEFWTATLRLWASPVNPVYGGIGKPSREKRKLRRPVFVQEPVQEPREDGYMGAPRAGTRTRLEEWARTDAVLEQSRTELSLIPALPPSRDCLGTRRAGQGTKESRHEVLSCMERPLS